MISAVGLENRKIKNILHNFVIVFLKTIVIVLLTSLSFDADFSVLGLLEIADFVQTKSFTRITVVGLAR